MKTRLGWAALLALAAAGCGDRAAVWSAPASDARAFGLTSAVVLVDAPAHRLVTLTPDGHGGLTTARFATGHEVVATTVQAHGDALFVLTAGHRGGLGDQQPDEAPRLTILDATTPALKARDIDLGDVLSDPLDGLAVDPTGRWAVLYASSVGSGALVTNPNELVIVDLEAAAGVRPATITLHSFGGRPEKLIFAPPLALPGGPTHLLIVQSAQELTLLSLESPKDSEVTVRLADASATRRPHPEEVVIDDGEPARTDDARLGIRFTGDRNVMMLQLQPAASGTGFTPTVNVADVGGVPSSIAFVRTDGGLRLAALIPTLARATLVDPLTTITSDVSLPGRYQSLSLVTAASGGATGPTADVALLWNSAAGQAGVAFWELGMAAGRPFRSIETVGIEGAVDAVLDVPTPHEALKVLRTASGFAFYVLDLADRTVSPLLTVSANVELTVSRKGQRVWTFAPKGTALATTDLSNKHVRTLHLDAPAQAIFEVAGVDDKRALVVLHQNGGGLGATVFDADQPDDGTRRIYGALLTEGPYDQK
jgi:hypothetical protein